MMLKPPCMTLLAAFCASGAAFASDAQYPTPGAHAFAPHVWERHFRPEGNTGIEKIAALANDDIAVVGITRGKETYADAWIARLTSEGETLWQKTLSLPDWQAFWDVAEDDAGHLYAAGSARHSDSGEDGWIVKFNAEGEQLWQKSYGGAGDDALSSILRLHDGSFALAGSFARDGSTHGWIAGIDHNGAVLWETEVSHEAEVRLTDMDVMSDGTLVAVGTAGADGDHVPLEARISSDRQLERISVSADRPGGYTAVTVLDDGSVVSSGIAIDNGTADGGFVRIVTPESGTRYLKITPGFLPAVTVAGPAGEFVVLGSKRQENDGERAAMLSFAANGNRQSEIVLGSTMGAAFQSAAILNDGQFVAAGSNTVTDDPNGRHGWVIAGRQANAASETQPPLTRENAVLAGSFSAVAEMCSTDFTVALSEEAATFAKANRMVQRERYDAGYFSETHGRAFYDTHGCREVWERDYGPDGEASKKLGFTILNRVE